MITVNYLYSRFDTTLQLTQRPVENALRTTSLPTWLNPEVRPAQRPTVKRRRAVPVANPRSVNPDRVVAHLQQRRNFSLSLRPISIESSQDEKSGANPAAAVDGHSVAVVAVELPVSMIFVELAPEMKIEEVPTVADELLTSLTVDGMTADVVPAPVVVVDEVVQVSESSVMGGLAPFVTSVELASEVLVQPIPITSAESLALSNVWVNPAGAIAPPANVDDVIKCPASPISVEQALEISDEHSALLNAVEVIPSAILVPAAVPEPTVHMPVISTILQQPDHDIEIAQLISKMSQCTFREQCWWMEEEQYPGGYIGQNPREHVRLHQEHRVSTVWRMERPFDHCNAWARVDGTAIRKDMSPDATGTLRAPRTGKVPIPLCTVWKDNVHIRPF